jgi:hypothetical protein
MVVVEPETLDALWLQTQSLWQKAYRLWFRVWHTPDVPLRRWLIARNANRMATELIKELENKTPD